MLPATYTTSAKLLHHPSQHLQQHLTKLVATTQAFYILTQTNTPMAFHGVLYALAVLLTFSTLCSATPLLVRQTYLPTSNLSVPNAGHLTCSTESYPDLDRSCVLASIEHFCHDHAGYQFPANASERSLRGKYTPWHPSSFSSADQIRPAPFYVEENVTVPAAPIYLSITKPAGGPYADCRYKLDAQECIAQMTEAIDACNDFGIVTVMSSGTLTDTTCGWQWEVDLSPRPLPPAPFEYNSTIGRYRAEIARPEQTCRSLDEFKLTSLR